MNYVSFQAIDSSRNESNKKEFKKSYLAKNKRRDLLNIELLHIKIAADALYHLRQRTSKKDIIYISI